MMTDIAAKQQHVNHGTEKDSILDFFQKLRTMVVSGLVVKFDNSVHNIEWLIASDLGAIIEPWPSGNDVVQRAFRLLYNLATVYGLDPSLFQRQLFLKHVLRSEIGTHCIFGLRERGIEFLETCFSVHLDKNGHIIMVQSTYHSLDTFYEERGDWEDEDILKIVEQKLGDKQIIYINEAGVVWLPNWEDARCELHLQLSVKTKQGDYICFIPQNGQVVKSYEIHIAASPRAGTAALYPSFWPALESDQEKVICKPVMLRDLEHTEKSMNGKYIRVIDQLNKRWLYQNRHFEVLPDTRSSHFDRLMVYYHIDRIQRYFRELGLHLLDDYAELNPITAVLRNSEELNAVTYYSPIDKTIYFEQIKMLNPSPDVSEYKWTDARDARLIYHEFVHAVTDSLARLRRNDWVSKKNPRFRQVLQAAAMDEGIADYFACSLAEIQGATEAEIGQLKVDYSSKRLTYEPLIYNDNRRQYGEKPNLQRVYNVDNELLKDATRDVREAFIYDWGIEYGRFLWQLRLKLGVEIADTLVAHSILFLSRWSGFSAGIWSLILADRLLFDAHHHKIIFDAAGIPPIEIDDVTEHQIRQRIKSDGSAAPMLFRSGEEVVETATINQSAAEIDLGTLWLEDAGKIVEIQLNHQTVERYLRQ